jgi:hypothetical protein
MSTGTETTILVGTTKGAFLLRPTGDGWQVEGPHCDGAPINHVIGDPATGTLWAAGGNDWTGIGVWQSEDGGKGWTRFDTGLTLDEGGETLSALWSLGRAGDRLYAGAKPAALFVSADRGETWQHLPGLRGHPSRPHWMPGGAGLVLHSIVSDPADARKLWVGISAVGVFGSEDGGATWEPRNRGTRNDYAPEDQRYPETGLCVHNLVRAPGSDDLMYQQNHFGVWRSADGGRAWTSIEAGLPSSFGFPVAVHPRDPQTIWVVPLNGDSIGRYPPEARAAVWRSRDGGATWADLRDGLPGRDCYFTVLRQAMAVDAGTPDRICFGTNSGSIFVSDDCGDHWSEIARHLPTVLSVETLATA